MKHLFTFVFSCLLTTLSAQNTWIVSNVPGFDADFTDLQTAINSATAGDILLIQGSAASYGNVTITKPLVLSGPGYFLAQNPQTQAQLSEATLGTLLIDNGGSGCIVEGLSILQGIALDSVNNVIIQSCRVESQYPYYTYYGLTANYSQSTVVRNCYFSNTYYAAILCNSPSSCIISNNIISNTGGGGIAGSNCIIENNVFAPTTFNNSYPYPVNVNASTVQNNIFSVGYAIVATNSSVVNNLFAGGFNGGIIINGNQEYVDMSTVFIGWANNGYSGDGRWQLLLGSPAIGAGVGGIDCGAWGGSSPYRLSGMSFNPNIWQVVMPTTGTSGGGMSVTVKANANQ